MKLVSKSISIQKLTPLASTRYGNLIKAVVDIDQQIMALSAELHADEEAFLLERGSKQDSLWGINLYPGKFGQKGFIEFDSVINLRPTQDNLTRNIDNSKTRNLITNTVNKLITK